MAVVFADYSKDRIGWFFGLTGWQLAALAVTVLPVFAAINAQRWSLAAGLAAAWMVVAGLVAVPVRGRSATGWLVAWLAHTLGAAAGWTSYRNLATQGRAGDPHEADLPGVLAGITIHDGPPHGPAQTRIAIIQNHATRTWAVTCAVTHPGIGLADATERHRQGSGLTNLLEVCHRTELIDEILFQVRTVPDDGAERALWVQQHRRGDSPPLATHVNDDLANALTRASVRTETFCTIVVGEARLGRDARESGGGLDGRARVLYGLMGEAEAALRGSLGASDVTWLTSPALALAVRTGFAPGDRAGIIEALAARDTNPDVNADVPWAMAGPSGADSVARHYSHDAWNSVSATVRLPDKGAVMGALAPVLAPSEPGERRSLLVAFPILPAGTADRQTANSEWAADMAAGLRGKLGVRPRARDRHQADKAHTLDDKLARGNALTRPYAVCTVTVPKTARITEYGRKLDAAIRRAGFAPLRLDLAQDAGFAAATIPLGVSLTRKSDA